MVEVPLLGLRADRVDALDVRGRAKRCDGQSLSLAAGEETGAVGTRQNTDLDRDRAQLVDATTVHADALVEDDLAGGLLLNQLEEALADPALAAGGVQEARGILAFLAVGADRDGNRVLQVLDAVREIARECGNDAGGRFGVGKAAVNGLDGDAEEARDIAQLVRLEIRIGLTSDHERVQVAALDELATLAQSLVQEANIEAHVVADDRSAGDEGEQLLGRFLGNRCARDLGIGDAVHLGAEDVAAGVHEGGEAIDDVAVANAHGADLDQVGNLGVAAGRLGVDYDELRAGLANLLDELENGAGAGIEIADGLRLADGGTHLILNVDERLEGAMAEEDGVGHDVFGNDRGAGLDHHDGVASAGDDQVDVRALEVADRGIDHELAVDATNAHRADGAQERDGTDRQGARGRERAEDVGLVLLVRGQDRDHDLDVVLVALGEERPDRPVGQPASQDRLL